MTCPAMVWLASSDFWKAPSDLTVLFSNLKLFRTVSVLCGLQIPSINNIIILFLHVSVFNDCSATLAARFK